MESDRAAANLGPDIEAEGGEDSGNVVDEPVAAAAPRQPGKRFIGRRAATALQAQSQPAPDAPGTSSQALDKSGPRGRPARLNQVPDDILQDDSLNASIAHLPANYNFEIHKTVHRIRTAGARSVALQFPEGLLMFAPLISDILTAACPGTDTVIMGDVTYGACCVDDYTARALGCDLLVHYGHSCLVPVDTTEIKTLYVFVTIGVDSAHLVASVEANFTPGKTIAMVGTIQFNATLHAVAPQLRARGFGIVLPRSAPLSAGEILGCTAPTVSKTDAVAAASSGADMILYVGDGRFHLEAIMIASPQLRASCYRYDPYSRRLTHEQYEHAEMHSLRSTAIQTAQRALTPISTWGLILGTLGRQGNPHTLDLVAAGLRARGVAAVTVLLSEVSPAKLALMSASVDVWVQVACPRLSIDWGYAFERPLLSPYEALVALGGREGAWTADSKSGGDGSGSSLDGPPIYPMDYYGKQGLGRTTARDVAAAGVADVASRVDGLEIEVS